jgi:hypothetical protein
MGALHPSILISVSLPPMFQVLGIPGEPKWRFMGVCDSIKFVIIPISIADKTVVTTAVATIDEVDLDIAFSPM